MATYTITPDHPSIARIVAMLTTMFGGEWHCPREIFNRYNVGNYGGRIGTMIFGENMSEREDEQENSCVLAYFDEDMIYVERGDKSVIFWVDPDWDAPSAS